MNDKLVKGITVFDLTSEDSFASLADRVQLNSGITKSQNNPTNQLYKDVSYIPRPAWRNPTVHEINLLKAEEWASFGTQIAIVKIPASILKPLEWMKPLTSGNILDMNESIKDSDYDTLQEVFDGILHYTRELGFSVEEPIRRIGITVSRPNLTTVTHDHRDNRFVGLHIDSWFNAAWDQRHVSPNRIAVNIGVEPRYLIFINVPIKRLLDHLTSLGYDRFKLSTLSGEFGDAVTKELANYPVVRIKLEPGEAYIAPTENMVHDGSTLGTHYLDLNLTMLGNFTTRISPKTSR